MYQEGNIKYYNAGDGKIYKQVGDGPRTLVNPKDYKYVPKKAGGTRDDGGGKSADSKKDGSTRDSSKDDSRRDRDSERSRETDEDVLKQLKDPLPPDAYSFPYEQLFRDMLASFPQAQFQTDDEMLGTANNYADMQVSSQLLALQQALDQAGVDAKSQKELIEGAYAGVADQLAQTTETQKAQALESAISRGGGRSGVVDWSNAKINEAQTSQLAQTEAQKAAQLANVANQLMSQKKQYTGQINQLEGQRGSLAQQFLHNLQNQNYANNTNAWNNKMGFTSDLSGKALNSNQFNQGLTLDWTNTIGKVPDSAPKSNPTYNQPVQPNTAAQPATPAKQINNDNEKAYLTNQYNSAIKSGNTGLASWAKNQAKQYGFSI